MAWLSIAACIGKLVKKIYRSICHGVLSDDLSWFVGRQCCFLEWLFNEWQCLRRIGKSKFPRLGYWWANSRQWTNHDPVVAVNNLLALNPAVRSQGNKKVFPPLLCGSVKESSLVECKKLEVISRLLTKARNLESCWLKNKIFNTNVGEEVWIRYFVQLKDCKKLLIILKRFKY